MSLATSNRDGGRTNEAGHLRGVTKGFAGQVLSGLAVSQRGAGANMSVDVAIGDAIIQRSDGTYGHPAWNDAVYNQVIAAADGSNPRRDIIVMYIDYGQTPSTGVANNTNGVVKITSVSGTAAGSPVDPSNATIQSAVGSGNPFVKLARVRVAAGATSISNSVIDDLRLMATAQPQGGWLHDTVNTWVYGSATTFTIAGVDVTAQFPVGSRIRLYQGGTVKYFTVLSSTFSTNTTVTINGGGTYTLANSPIDKPAYSYDYTPSGYPPSIDSAVNSVYAETLSSQGSIVASEVDLTGLAVTINAKPGCKIRVSYSLWMSTTVANDVARVFVKEGATYLGSNTQRLNAAVTGFQITGDVIIKAPSAGSHTYKLAITRLQGTGTLTSNAGAPSASNTPPFIFAEIC